MAEQETLPGTHDPGGIWRRYVHHGQIEHGAWLRARAEGAPIGSCRRCGANLYPEAPHDRGGGQFDYEASCHTPRCGGILTAPGGRVWRGDTTAWSRTGGAARAAALARQGREEGRSYAQSA